LSDPWEGIEIGEIQMHLEFCLWRDSQNVKILLLSTAIPRAACILVCHAFGQGGGKKKGAGSCLEGAGKWFEMILALGAGGKERCFGGWRCLLETK